MEKNRIRSTNPNPNPKNTVQCRPWIGLEVGTYLYSIAKVLGGDCDIARGGGRATVYTAAATVTGGRCTEQRKTGEGGRVEWAGWRSGG